MAWIVLAGTTVWDTRPAASDGFAAFLPLVAGFGIDVDLLDSTTEFAAACAPDCASILFLLDCRVCLGFTKLSCSDVISLEGGFRPVSCLGTCWTAVLLGIVCREPDS